MIYDLWDMEAALTFSNFYKHPRFWRHFRAWIIFLFFLAILISVGAEHNEDEKLSDSLLDMLIFFVGILFLIYASFFAYNKLHPKKQHLKLASIFLGIIVVSALINDLVGVHGVQLGGLQGFWANLVMYPFILMVAFGFKLAYHGARQLLVIERLKNKQTESELKLLKSQVNPHFLFNTLNNIYATNLEDHEKANNIILELADVLRYQLKSQSKALMPVDEEIGILENYISLEKIRVKDCVIRLDKQGAFGTVKIVPLLLLPFVENAFKYGTGIESGEIDLKFELDDKNHFLFHCKNKIVQRKGKVHSGGIGLENVKKRLALKYGPGHRLDISKNNNFFEVKLEIENLDLV